jgi:peptidoglycan/LPS O-acetylase OafA/YrhL
MRRIAELDALRGIAAIVIVVFHLRFVDGAPVLGTAVDLFFVLSGYLITTIILDQRRSPGFFKTFYARRALRIWPIYYLALVACVALNPLLARPEPLAGFWQAFAYLQNVPGYWHGESPPFSRLFSHSWTLAIEEQFYLLWPLAVVLAGRKRLRWAIAPFLVAPLVMRSLGFHRHMLLTRCDGLALGALLADLFYERARVEAHRRLYRRAFAAIALLAVVGRQIGGPLLNQLDGPSPGIWSIRSFSMATAAMGWIYFGVVGLVLLDHGHSRLAWLRNRRLVHLGTISYGIYLYHPFVLIFVPILHKAMGIKGSIWIDIGKVGLCVILAEISWRLIERPLLRLKDRFPYTPSQSEAVGSFRGPHTSIGVKEESSCALIASDEPPGGRGRSPRKP